MYMVYGVKIMDSEVFFKSEHLPLPHLLKSRETMLDLYGCAYTRHLVWSRLITSAVNFSRLYVRPY